MPGGLPRGPRRAGPDGRLRRCASTTRNGRRSPNGRTGSRTASMVTSRPGSPAMGTVAQAGGPRGLGSRRASPPSGKPRPSRPPRLDYADGRPLDRRGRALRGFDRAVALRPRDAGDPGDGVVGRRGSRRTRSVRARQAIVDKGCRRGAMTAHWALGYVAMSRGELDDATAALTDALEFGTVERGDRAHPAAAVGSRRGRPAGRRPGPRTRALSRRPRPRHRRSASACS